MQKKFTHQTEERGVQKELWKLCCSISLVMQPIKSLHFKCCSAYQIPANSNSQNTLDYDVPFRMHLERFLIRPEQMKGTGLSLGWMMLSKLWFTLNIPTYNTFLHKDWRRNLSWTIILPNSSLPCFRKENSWQWPTLEPITYSNWAKGEPNNEGKTGKWSKRQNRLFSQKSIRKLDI